MRSLSTAILLLAPLFAFAVGQDWPQFLGPGRNGVYGGPPVSDVWPEDGPDILWQREIGQGFAAPVVADGKLILFHRIEDRETVDALDASSGEPLWRFDYPTRYRDDFGFDEGPRAAPVVAGERVVTFGAQGNLHALDLDSGEQLWSVATHSAFEVRKGFFGAASGPVVEDGKVLLNVGSRDGAGVVAFDLSVGEVLWQASRHEASYSAPVVASFDGERVALFFTREGLLGLHPGTGAVRFEKRWRSRSQSSVNAATPLVIDDQIFLSASYGTGAVLLRVADTELETLWSSDEVLSSHYATSVYRNGYLYGYHGRQEYGPSLRAVDLRTGAVQWSEDGFRAGTVTLAGENLLLLRESGELVVAPANPLRFRATARARILPGVVRAYPVLAGGLFYARNDDTLVCVDLRRSNE